MKLHHQLQVAYALTSLDSANTALRTMIDRLDLRPIQRHVKLVIRPSELLGWAELWRAMRAPELGPNALPNYDHCVQDARVYLREHLDEALAWETQVDPMFPSLKELFDDDPAPAQASGPAASSEAGKVADPL